MEPGLTPVNDYFTKTSEKVRPWFALYGAFGTQATQTPRPPTKTRHSARLGLVLHRRHAPGWQRLRRTRVVAKRTAEPSLVQRALQVIESLDSALYL